MWGLDDESRPPIDPSNGGGLYLLWTRQCPLLFVISLDPGHSSCQIGRDETNQYDRYIYNIHNIHNMLLNQKLYSTDYYTFTFEIQDILLPDHV